ncbi:DUF397 domain-containing protein [Streptomyces alfalfae]|uniref:DUF397 domain-containing protein n=1 Tax=Streptomyces alfalfae TaxID=1642299 RepID=UPI001BAB61B6|nr:DUF397 domain-containing protein [Streptomyces alfalfae]QUI32388.1 DUF397 domain-containing protein [Streptomyces alfalfae]
MENCTPEYAYDLSAAVWHKSSYSGGQGGDCLEVARWHKSTYSDGSGGNCLEMARNFPGAARWRKSSHSAGDGGDCLEVADGHPEVVPVRDSKNPAGPRLVFRAPAWSAFIGGLPGIKGSPDGRPGVCPTP